MVTSTDVVDVAGSLQPPRTFDVASAQVVDYLTEVVPMGLWAVTRVVDGRQILLVANDRDYGFGPGAEVPFSYSPCHAMVSGAAPQIAPNAMAIPEYRDTGVASQVRLGAYIGTPIVSPEGQLFGTVCGFNQDPLPETLKAHEPLLALLSGLLSSVLEADHAATTARRSLEAVQVEADTDALTGLLNRRGWDRHLEREEGTFRRFGDQASVVVMDLDGLKVINDTRGHDAGDAHLRRTAAALRAAVRSGDVLARLGGDEFWVVAVGAAADAIDRVLLRMRHSLDSAGIAGSFGAAAITVTDGLAGAWKRADVAMYDDKRFRRAALD
ncbi:diguanylate cyclase (GGDEF)-like protein [Nakamurella sp. UYEF19]|uniref:GGDEF domain-containing protein n=1 Tax=Nakamurella sp. UYEF19 TaxID=1756392 RepID=UPI003393BBA7